MENHQLLEELIRKVVSENKDITLMKFKDEYIEAIRYTHSEAYLRTVKASFNQLLKFTDNVPLIRCEVKLIEKFVNKTFQRSKHAAALYYRTLKAAFNKAVDWNYIPSNPFHKIKLPRIQKNRPEFIDFSQLKEILKYTPAEIKEVYEFAFFTGMRLSEIINLRWINVNLKENIIQVGDKDFITKGKKIRTLPMCNQAYIILQNRFPKIIKHNRDFVFCKKNGFPYSADYISKRFKKGVRKAGLNDKVHFHSLRHSFASNLIKEGVSIYSLKELLGHSSIAVTEIYSHLDMSSLRIAVNKFNSITGS